VKHQSPAALSQQHHVVGGGWQPHAARVSGVKIGCGHGERLAGLATSRAGRPAPTFSPLPTHWAPTLLPVRQCCPPVPMRNSSAHRSLGYHQPGPSTTTSPVVPAHPYTPTHLHTPSYTRPAKTVAPSLDAQAGCRPAAATSHLNSSQLHGIRLTKLLYR
jgi:hypothetical protein